MSGNGDFIVNWIDSGREPQFPPNPLNPEGISLDGAIGSLPACETELPYPARRCGRFEIECKSCGVFIVVTTAGRPDDPKSVKINCLTPEEAQE